MTADRRAGCATSSAGFRPVTCGWRWRHCAMTAPGDRPGGMSSSTASNPRANCPATPSATCSSPPCGRSTATMWPGSTGWPDCCAPTDACCRCRRCGYGPRRWGVSRPLPGRAPAGRAPPHPGACWDPAPGPRPPEAFGPLTIEADVKFPGSFQVVRGQSVLASTLGHVETVRLDPAAPPARYETVEAVQEAEVLNLGPGSWYTSVMPHLLVPSLAEARGDSGAVKSLTLNLSSSDGETRDLSLGEHLMSLHRHAPSLRLDYVLVDEAATALEPDLARRALDMFDAKLWQRPLRSWWQG